MIGIIIVVVLALIGFLGIRIVEQTERGLVETFGKYTRYANPGFSWIIPGIQSMRTIDVTENLAEAEPQVIITKDKLNATVNAQVYYKVKLTEEDVKASQYNVANYEDQIINLTRTTLRNIIGNMTLRETNSERNKINKQLMEILTKETKNWGIQFTRAELQEIDPPQDVQETMNKVVKAENEKIAAIDFATAVETKADGEKRAAVKTAEGERQANILNAQGEAQAIEIKAKAQAEAIKQVNQAARKYFVGNAQKLKQLEVTQASLEKNSKIILAHKGINPTILMGSGKIEV